MTLRLLALVAVLSVSSSACGGDSEAGSPVNTTGGRSSGVTTGSVAPPGEAARFVETGAGPVGLVRDSRGRVWVANADAGTVSRLTKDGKSVDVSRGVGQAPLRLAATPGSIWVTVFTGGLLLRLDDRSGEITAKIPIGKSPEGIVYLAGSLWVVLEDQGQLVQVDPERQQVVHRFHVGAGVRLVTGGDDVLWVSNYTNGRVSRVDPATGDMQRSAVLCAGPQGMHVLARTVWVACTLGNELVGVSTETLKVTGRLSLPGSPDAVGSDANRDVVVALQKGPTLAVVDPAGPTLRDRTRLGRVDQLYDRANIDLLCCAGGAWVSSYLEGGLYGVR